MTANPAADLVAIDDALKSLAAVDPRKSEIVELRFFGGLSVKETADVLKVSEETVHRDWKLAKRWLRRELETGEASRWSLSAGRRSSACIIDALAQERSRRPEFLEHACARRRAAAPRCVSLLEHSEEQGISWKRRLCRWRPGLWRLRLAATKARRHTQCPPPSAVTASSACWAKAEWARCTKPSRRIRAASVALKVIRPGLATPERLRRFKHESQALGRLQHPGIAQIYEASTADAGFGPQPFFAMELIRGQSLDVYAAAHPLSTRSRLALMARICDAVHHAHQRGLIHRDLKPGNILVDETGQPKILDFGVARITESDGQATQQTELGQIVGTLAYMSPEQVLGDQLEVDTRSDVYSLGVILYELLSGRSPL